MNAPNTGGRPAHSAATKNATSAPAWAICIGFLSAYARHRPATRAAANMTRPTSGVGGERSHQ